MVKTKRVILEESHASNAPHSLFFSLFGNHPLSTLFRWSKTSLMLQKQEKATTPRSDETVWFSASTDKTTQTSPARRNTHQHFTPK